MEEIDASDELFHLAETVWAADKIPFPRGPFLMVRGLAFLLEKLKKSSDKIHFISLD